MAAKEPLSALPRTHMGGILMEHGAARCRVRQVWGLLDLSRVRRLWCSGQVSGISWNRHQEPAIRLGVDQSGWTLPSIEPGGVMTAASHTVFPAMMDSFGSF